MARTFKGNPASAGRHTRGWGLALIALFVATMSATAQPASAPRSRDFLKTGIEQYSSNNYEAAAAAFEQASLHPEDLELAERRDLAAYSAQTAVALKQRQEGTALLARADEALRAGKMQDAANLLKAAHANQYLSPDDRKALVAMNSQLRSGAGGADKRAALLTAARTALQHGDFDRADQFALEADRIGGPAGWMRPWEDNPTKVRREIQAARQKQATPARPAEAETKDSSWTFAGMKNMFNRGNEAKPGPNDPKPAPFPSADVPPGQPMYAAAPEPGSPIVPVTYAEQAPSPMPDPAAAEQARQLLRDGFRAAEANDLPAARRYAERARELQPDGSTDENGPDQLMQEVQRRAASNPPSQATPAAAAAAAGKPDPRSLVREARQLMQQNRLDEAEKRLGLAGTGAGTSWGLFEDSPDKVRRDLQRARAKTDREEADRLLGEARKLFAKGDLDGAKRRAWKAQQLHGPYGALDFGDRPQNLLQEIQRLELKQGVAPATAPRAEQPAARADQPAPRDAAPLVSAATQAETKNRAVALVQEARELERQGRLGEAQQRANEARQLNVAFTPEEDSPGAVLQSLGASCNRHIIGLVQQAGAHAMNANDLQRFAKAKTDLDNARQLAQAFGQDTRPIDEGLLALQQMANAAGSNPVALQPTPPTPDVPAVHETASIDPQVQAARQAGMERLDKARLELRAGNYAVARKLAEDAFAPGFGIQAEAETVLRSIYADEYNSRVLATRRTFDAGVEAFHRHDYRQAMGLFASLDLQLLPPEHQSRLRELMCSREMQPQAIAQVQYKEPVDSKPALPPAPGIPGRAQVGEAAPDVSYLENVKALEEVQFQQLRQRGLDVQRKALELFSAGQDARAVEVLNGYLEQVGGIQLDTERLTLLRRPVENRLQQYRTVQAQNLLRDEKAKIKKASKYSESDREAHIEQSQKEVADLMKQYNSLMREGKANEAEASLKKAQELDPENPAVQAGIEINRVKRRQKFLDAEKADTEEMFLTSLDNKFGKIPTEDDPFPMSDSGRKRIIGRKGSEKGVWPQVRTSRERAIELKLNEPITLDVKDMSLRQVIGDLRQMSGVNIIPNERTLRQDGISLEQPLSISVTDIPLKSALNHLLGGVKLTYVIRDDALVITTTDDGQGRMRTVVYSVTDLVIPVDNHVTPNVNSLQAALERHISGSGGLNIYPPSPITQPMSLQSGTPVSDYSSGLGRSSAAAPSNAQAGTNSPAASSTRMPGATIERQLMELIKNTVAKNTWDDVGGQGSVQYFPLGMALVVNQTQEVQEEVQNLLAALRRLQDLEVSIEMRLITVSEAFFERMGVDFDVNIQTPTSRNEVQLVNSQFTQAPFVNRNLSGLNTVTGLTPAGTLTPDLNIPINNSSFGFSVPPFGGYPGTLGADGGLSLGLAFLNDIQVYMFLEAAQGDQRTQTMQAPKITVFNGQTANISVQEQQFFLIGVQLIPVNGQILFAPQNTPFPVGVTLQVTPVISADRRFVRLNLTPTLTNIPVPAVPLIPVSIPVPNVVQGPGAGVTQVGQPVIFQMFFQQPTFESISINTTVNVPDGGTVLLGGLKTLSEGRNEFGPPILSKIPYLSRLFKNVAYGRQAQSLMIMVTPRIIINEEEELIFRGELPPIPRP